MGTKLIHILVKKEIFSWSSTMEKKKKKNLSLGSEFKDHTFDAKTERIIPRQVGLIKSDWIMTNLNHVWHRVKHMMSGLNCILLVPAWVANQWDQPESCGLKYAAWIYAAWIKSTYKRVKDSMTSTGSKDKNNLKIKSNSHVKQSLCINLSKCRLDDHDNVVFFSNQFVEKSRTHQKLARDHQTPKKGNNAVILC